MEENKYIKYIDPTILGICFDYLNEEVLPKDFSNPSERKMKNISTLGDLKRERIEIIPIKQELKINLIKKLKEKKTLFNDIIGYEKSVIPNIENAILAYHDIILLGERGQAKSRLLNSLVSLLDDEIAFLKGCEINDNPFNPICKECQDTIVKKGDKAEISWLKREERFIEKLATPDTSLSDLLGDIDPIKVAEGRYLSDPMTIHYGLIPRSNRCIFAINELPDLPERIQVGLFNILEERQIQIKGYNLKFNLDIFLTATANPEDYTNRGKIITPLRDRYNSQIRTHYPKTIEDEIRIIENEKVNNFMNGLCEDVPYFIKEIIAQITHILRTNDKIDQNSGVSVRVSIDNYENVIANAEKRTIILGEKRVVPRITDIYSTIFSTTHGKLEINLLNDELNEEKLVESAIAGGIKKIFSKYFKGHEFEEVTEFINSGEEIFISDVDGNDRFKFYLDKFQHTKKLLNKTTSLEHLDCLQSAFEFALEGLFLNNKIDKIKLNQNERIYKNNNSF